MKRSRWWLGGMMVVLVTTMVVEMARKAEAKIEERLTGLGASLVDVLDDPRLRNLDRTLRVNDETLQFSTGSTDDSPDAVVEAFRKSHAGRDGGLSKRLGRRLRLDPSPVNVMTLGRRDRACAVAVDLGEHDLSADELRRLLDTAAQGRLPGALDYVFAERSDGRTVTFRLHAAPGVSLLGMLEDQGGRCALNGLAGPDGASCVMAACEDDAGFCLGVFDLGSSFDAAQCLERAVRDLGRQGWDARRTQDGIVAMQDNRYLFASCSEQKGRAILTLVEKGGRDER